MDYLPDIEIDELTGKPKIVQLQQNSLVYNPLNRKLLYTKAEVDAKISSISTGTSGITRSISSISSPATAGAATNTDYVYLISGTTTLTLPTAVGNTNRYTVTNVGSNTVTVATTSAQTIDGSATATLPVANMSLDIVSNGSNWFVI